MSEYNTLNVLPCMQRTPHLVASPHSLITSIHNDLMKKKDEIFSLLLQFMPYSHHEHELLWDETIRYLENLPALMDLHTKLTHEENQLYQKLNPNFELQLKPYGRVFISIPSNAPLPLAIVLPLSFCLSGNSVYVTGSSKIQPIITYLFQIIASYFPNQIALWCGKTAELLDHLCETKAVDLIYFMGASSYYTEIAQKAARAGAHLIYEGEGRCAYAIDPRLDTPALKTAVSYIAASKQSFAGHMCSAPNSIVCSHEQKDYICKRLKEISPAIKIHPDADGNAIYDNEWFSFDCYIQSHDTRESIKAAIQKNPYGLQLAVFSDDDLFMQTLKDETHFARYCFNMTPIEQDSLMPWGNFSLSGNSDVLDFYRKGLRRIWIETSTL